MSATRPSNNRIAPFSSLGKFSHEQLPRTSFSVASISFTLLSDLFHVFPIFSFLSFLPPLPLFLSYSTHRFTISINAPTQTYYGQILAISHPVIVMASSFVCFICLSMVKCSKNNTFSDDGTVGGQRPKIRDQDEGETGKRYISSL